jgi:thiosulfate reductase cytochrome b subunit
MSDEPLLTLTPKHPLWVRWAHWINFPILTLMLVSGIQIYWANRIYTPFISDRVYEALGISYHLAPGLALHFAMMWIFIVNGALYFLYIFISGEWREIAPKASSFRDAGLVLLHDLKLRKELPTQGKFNGAQKIAYSSVLIMGVMAALSGLVMYKPVQMSWLTHLLNGYETARLIHFLIAIGFIAFFAMHLMQVIRAGWNNFQAMITGYEVEDEQKNHPH